jgi:hypothetical protein
MDLADVRAASIVRTAGAAQTDHPARQAGSVRFSARTTTPSPVHAGAQAPSVR